MFCYTCVSSFFLWYLLMFAFVFLFDFKLWFSSHLCNCNLCLCTCTLDLSMQALIGDIYHTQTQTLSHCHTAHAPSHDMHMHVHMHTCTCTHPTFFFTAHVTLAHHSAKKLPYVRYSNKRPPHALSVGEVQPNLEDTQLTICINYN